MVIKLRIKREIGKSQVLLGEEEWLLENFGLFFSSNTLPRQGELYDRIKEMAEKEGISAIKEIPWGNYHPNDKNFNIGCDGWKGFLRIWGTLSVPNKTKMGEFFLKAALEMRSLLEEQSLIVEYIMSEVVYPQLERKISTEVHVSSPEAFLKTPEGVFYLVKAKSPSPEIGPMEVALKGIQEHLEGEVRRLQDEYESEKKRLREEMSSLLVQSLQKGLELGGRWKIEGGKAVYREKIVPRRLKKLGAIKELSTDNPFFVKGLSVDLSSGKAFCKDAFHPNVSSDQNVCEGDLQGREIFQILENLPGLLETINLDSHYDNEASDEAERIYEQLASEKVQVEVWGEEEWT